VDQGDRCSNSSGGHGRSASTWGSSCLLVGYDATHGRGRQQPHCSRDSKRTTTHKCNSSYDSRIILPSSCPNIAIVLLQSISQRAQQCLEHVVDIAMHFPRFSGMRASVQPGYCFGKRRPPPSNHTALAYLGRHWLSILASTRLIRGPNHSAVRRHSGRLYATFHLCICVTDE
jgi:hypothetical protein